MEVKQAFQTALYSTLTANAPLMAAISDVFDVRPQVEDGGDDANFPFVTIGAILDANDDTKTELAFDVVVRIHTFSRSGSMAEARNIQGLLYSALHRNEPAMSGHTVVSLTRQGSETFHNDDNFQGVCEYHALIQTN